jgi:hypothetical protein
MDVEAELKVAATTSPRRTRYPLPPAMRLSNIEIRLP